jgi:hypothetical protein
MADVVNESSAAATFHVECDEITHNTIRTTNIVLAPPMSIVPHGDQQRFADHFAAG